MKVFFLVKVEAGQMDEVNQRILEFDEISEACPTFGGWDVVAIGNFETHEQVTKFMREQLIEIDGVRESNSLIEARA